MTKLFAAGCLALLAACEAQPVHPAASERPANLGNGADPPANVARFVVAVQSDYASSAVSVLDLGGDPSSPAAPLVWRNVVNSGSLFGATSQALSGDVVVARTATADRRALLVDRASAVISVMDPRTGKIERQVAVGQGFHANPQDAVVLPNGDWLVPRMGRNPHPTPAAGDFDDGDDVVQVRAGQIIAQTRLNAGAQAPGTVAAPQRPAWMADAQLLAVPLGSFSASFEQQGAASVAWLSVGAAEPLLPAAPMSVAVADTGLRNCVAAVAVPGQGAVALACLGHFKSSNPFAESGLAQLSEGAAAGAWPMLMASNPGVGRFSKDLVAVAPRAGCAGGLFAVGSGEIGAAPDKLWRIDAGSTSLVATASGPYQFSGLWADSARGVLWAGDRGNPAGDLRRFALCSGAVHELPALTLRTNGLGVVELAGQ